MSQKTQSDIQFYIDGRIASNSSKDISASDVREVLTHMNDSFNGPIMIYHGRLKAKTSSASATVKDYYVNFNFFKQQNTGNPLSSTNVVQLNTIGVPGAPNETASVTLGGGKLRIKFTVASNVITQLEVLRVGGGIQVGETLNYTYFGTVLSFTYNGVITDNNVRGLHHRFLLSTNPALGYDDHTEKNTLIQTSAVSLGRYIDDWGSQMISDNELLCLLTESNKNDAEELHVTLWRVAQ
jgi:hypothetical protein